MFGLTANWTLLAAASVTPRCSYTRAVLAELQSWTIRRWVIAVAVAMIVILLVGLPTDVIPNPVFGRPVAVTWWSYPVLVVTGMLSGLLAATYVRDDRFIAADSLTDADERVARAGGFAGVLSFFAVGCPVCNKLVVIALGTVGARRWFEPFQPLLAVGSVVLMAVALRARLRNATSCPVPAR